MTTPRRLPSLNQLRAFEAAARHASFKAAADELHVTQAAVSHQIKGLEEDLGVPLFHRMTRKVRLTEKGAAMTPALTRAFDDISAAVEAARRGAMEGELVISTAPFFGNRAILPLIETFHAAHPGLRIRLGMDAGVVDFGKSEIDAAIRYGTGDWPGLDQIRLQHNRVVAVAAPGYLGDRSLPLELAEIASLTLGSVSGRDYHWFDWFRAQGYDPGDRLNLIDYNNKARALDLALTGNGVALDDVRLLQRELQSGQLVQIHPFVHKQNTSIFLVYPKTSAGDARLGRLGEWLRERLAARG